MKFIFGLFKFGGTKEKQGKVPPFKELNKFYKEQGMQYSQYGNSIYSPDAPKIVEDEVI